MKHHAILRSTIRLAALAIIFFCCVQAIQAQVKPTFSQQIYLMKQLKPTLKSVGVMSGSMKQEDIESLVRAGLGQGITVSVALPKNPQEIPGLARTLVTERKVEMILLPFANDEIMNGIGFEYLREQAINNKIGLCVSTERLVSAGGLCFMESVGEKIVVHVNTRIAAAIDIRVPSESQATVAYLSR